NCTTPPPPPQQQQARQLMQLLQQSGIIAAVCGALATVSPRQYEASGALAGACSNRTKEPLETLQKALPCVVHALRTLHDHEERFQGREQEVLVEVLAAPEVVALQRGLLERVILDGGGGGDEGDEGDDLGYSGGSEGSLPLLDSVRGLAVLMPPEDRATGRKLPLETVHYCIVYPSLASWKAVGGLRRVPSALPSDPERARLAVRLLRALHRLVCGRGVGGQYDMTSAGADPDKVSRNVLHVASAALCDTPLDKGNSQMVADRRESCAWIMVIANELARAGWASDADADSFRGLLPSVMTHWHSISVAPLPDDVRCGLAARLGRARLLRNFDTFLRRTAMDDLPAAAGSAGSASLAAAPSATAAAADVTGAPKLADMLSCSGGVLDPQLADVLTETWGRLLSGSEVEGNGSSSSSGADGGGRRAGQQAVDADKDPWDGRRELGFFITVSKLALREAALECCQESPATAAAAGRPKLLYH
ncbi:hypothetical protein Agub_g738, partial [Astrephomene gubernaculifera]